MANTAKRLVALMLLNFVGTMPAEAATLSTEVVGYYSHFVAWNSVGTITAETYQHFDDPANYLAGGQSSVLPNGAKLQSEWRPYLAFDMSGSIADISNASLRLFVQGNQLESNCQKADSGGCGYGSDDLSETLVLRSVTTTHADVLYPASGTEDMVFSDLAEGTIYGSRVMTSADAEPPAGLSGKWIEIPLSSAAIGSLNDSDSIWLVGLHVSTLGTPDDLPVDSVKRERLFVDSVLDQPFLLAPQLVFEVVPEPASIAMLGIALALLGIPRRTAKCRGASSRK